MVKRVVGAVEVGQCAVEGRCAGGCFIRCGGAHGIGVEVYRTEAPIPSKFSGGGRLLRVFVSIRSRYLAYGSAEVSLD